jgi:hypothetical protein
VWVKAYSPVGANSGKTDLYRGIPDQSGALTPFYVCEIAPQGSTAPNSTGGFAELGDLLLFGWPTMHTGLSGVGVVNMRTGGWSKGYAATTTGAVPTVCVYHGQPIFSLAGNGVWTVDFTDYETTGYVDLSIVDGGAVALDKVFDSVTVTMDPIGANQAISFKFSTDNGGSFTDAYLEGTVETLINQAGLTEMTIPLNQKAPGIQIRMTLAGPGTTSPNVLNVALKYHQLGLADTIVQIPILCTDRQTLLSGRIDEASHEGFGSLQAYNLRQMSGTRVLFQDVDYQVTGEAEVYEVVQTDRTGYGLMDKSTGKKAWSWVVDMTLRKVGV